MGFTDRLILAVDWFVPAELQQSTANHWRARIFVISHVLGPFSSVAIMGYLYRIQPAGWRQLPCPVDDNYLGRFDAIAGQVCEVGLP